MGSPQHSRGGPSIWAESRKMNYVYVLISGKDKKLYIGSTSDLKRRLTEHKNGKVKSTCYRLPLTLLLYEAYRSKKVALNREVFLKSSDGGKDIKKRLGEVPEWPNGAHC